jgi:hypothetical protein
MSYQKNAFPCKECILYAICRSKLIEEHKICTDDILSDPDTYEGYDLSIVPWIACEASIYEECSLITTKGMWLDNKEQIIRANEIFDHFDIE